MWAEVRVMCSNGRRLPRDQVRALAPVRGDLSVVRRRDPWRNAWVPIAVLRSEGRELPALDEVRISKWSGTNLVLVGLEHVGRLKQSQPQLQAWWVQLVSGPDPPRTATSEPSE